MNLLKSLLVKFKDKELNEIQRNLYRHVDHISNQIGERNHVSYYNLEKTYEYILNELQRFSYSVDDLDYSHEKLTFHNVVAEKQGYLKPEEIIVIGAHYDTVINSPGADDNTSGIAALLEFARLMDSYQSNRTLRFVAFSQEEPPYFGTNHMGSYVYAKRCKKKKENIIGMIALEMLAYFTDKRKSQKYPLPALEEIYPDVGNFIGIVGNNQSRAMVESLAENMKQEKGVPVESIVTYAGVPGIDLSDHSSFWKMGYKAVMITDTAFYRNPYYHRPNDTIKTLNFKSYARLVHAMRIAIEKLDSNGF